MKKFIEIFFKIMFPILKLQDHYTLFNSLGKGTQGVVFLGVTKAGEKVAIKRLATNNAKHRIMLSREIKILKLLAKLPCSEHVVGYRTSFKDKETGLLYLVLDYYEGYTLDCVNAVWSNGVDIQVALNMLVDLLTSLKYIHDHKIVHGDIKLQNILIHTTENKLRPILIDFGLSCNLDDESCHKNYRCSDVFGARNRETSR